MVKNISVIQRLSVSWCSGSLMEIEIQIYFQIRQFNRKNISEIREKYLRIDKSVDRSTPDSDILENLSKSGENSVLSYCGGRYLFERIDQS